MSAEVPNGWELVPLGAIAEERAERVGRRERDPTVLSSTKHFGLVPSDEYFKGRTIYSGDLSNYKVVRANWFAYATNHLAEGSIGLQDLLEEACVSPIYTVFEAAPRVHPPFLRVVLKHWSTMNQYKVHEQATVDRRGAVRFKDFARVVVKLPPLIEQRGIAVALDTVDDAIRKTEEIIAKLKQVKQGLLHDLLTRGIDDNGELRDPDRHPEQFKDSPLGRIPKAWAVGGLLDVGATDRQPILTGPFGAQLGSADFTDHGVPVLRIGNVRWGYLDLDDLRFVSPEKAVSLERFRVSEGDLLFARQGATTGRNALADCPADGFLINYHIIRVAVDRTRCHPTFLYAVFNSPIVQAQVDREKGRSTREGVSTKTLTSFTLPLPPIGEQSRLAVALEAQDTRVRHEEREAEKLRLLKRGLMEDLLTGRSRVTAPLEEAAG